MGVLQLGDAILYRTWGEPTIPSTCFSSSVAHSFIIDPSPYPQSGCRRQCLCLGAETVETLDVTKSPKVFVNLTLRKYLGGPLHNREKLAESHNLILRKYLEGRGATLGLCHFFHNLTLRKI